MEVQVGVRVTPAHPTEFEQAALAERRSLANFAQVILEWGFEQFKMVGSTERLSKCKIRSSSRDQKARLPNERQNTQTRLGRRSACDRFAITGYM
jgi:hypothetical protein